LHRRAVISLIATAGALSAPPIVLAKEKHRNNGWLSGQRPRVAAAIRLGGPDQHGDVDLPQDALCDLAGRLPELDERARVEAVKPPR
jgi:hypothetical protein